MDQLASTPPPTPPLRGRALRFARGRYRFSHTARSTARRIGILARRSRAWVVAIMRQKATTGALPPGLTAPAADLGRPPWADLAWLRNT